MLLSPCKLAPLAAVFSSAVKVDQRNDQPASRAS